MMMRFEKKYGNVIPVWSGDFTPYWEDGAYSTASEEGENRMLSNKLSQLMKLNKMISGKNINPEWFYNVRKNVIMFHEHTWGAWNSISAPDDAFAINQWNYKKAFIDSAKKYMHKIDSVLIPEIKDARTLTIYNTLPSIRSGYVETKLPTNITGNTLVDETGKTCLCQQLSNGNICFIVKDIPPFGSKKYNITFSEKKELLPTDTYKFQIDSISGAIKSLYTLNKEWVSTKEFNGLNQVLYISGLDPDSISSSVKNKIEIIENGPVIKIFKISSQLKGTNSLSYYLSFFQDMNYIKLSCLIDKSAVRKKEAIHIVFPFNIDNPVDRIGISDTFYIPGKGQIQGSNNDFYSVQSWLDISNEKEGVTVSSPQGALFEFGKITDERPINNGSKKWKEYAEVSSTLFLYALNNYWNTNFKSDQQGLIKFDCYVKFHKSFEINDARIFGNEVHTPLIPVWEK
jgi:alpha-mannosidase